MGLIRSDHPSLPNPSPADQPLRLEQIEDMVRAAARASGGLETVLSPDARSVAIKVNLVEAKPRGDGTVTDWRVVHAVARLVHEIAPAAIVKVIETPDWDAPGIDWRRADGWGRAGYDTLKTLPYVRLVNMNYDSTYTRPIEAGGLLRDDFLVATTTDTVDCFISAPVVKVIGVVGMTAAMKNLVGMIPISEIGGRTHYLNHGSGYLDEGIVEMSLLHPIDFVVADVIVGLERAKTTSWGGQPVRMNTILAGPDAVAADAVAASLIGLNPDDLEYLTLAQRLGLGVADMDRIDVRGDDLASIRRRFRKYGSLEDRYGQTPKVWTLHGPHEAEGPDQEFLDPRNLDVLPGYNGWSELRYFRTDRINIKKVVGRVRNASVYAYTEFHAPRDEPAELWVGSGEGLTIWIDGEEVYRFRGRRRHRIPNEKHPIQLEAGDHQLLVQVHQSAEAFDFSLNICEAMDDYWYIGNRVPGLKFRPPGHRLPPVPRTGEGFRIPRFELGEWVTSETYDMEVLDVIDQSKGLTAQGIRRIDLDAQGRLWVSGHNGVHCRTSDSTWTVHRDEDGVPAGWTRDLIANPNDSSIWANVGGKIYRYDEQGWEAFPESPHGQFAIDHKGRACATLWGGGLRCYDNGKWASYWVNGEELEHANNVDTACFEADGTAWLGTGGTGLFRSVSDGWEQFTTEHGLADNHARFMRIAPNGDIWVAFSEIGISHFHQGRWISHWEHGAPELGVNALLIASDGDVWVASDPGVVSRYDGRRWASAMCSADITDMVEDAQGRIWLSTHEVVVVTRLD
ncbi:DUF362 domain-containing protein [Candidatus Latescibacterota bacterium]